MEEVEFAEGVPHAHYIWMIFTFFVATIFICFSGCVATVILRWAYKNATRQRLQALDDEARQEAAAKGQAEMYLIVAALLQKLTNVNTNVAQKVTTAEEIHPVPKQIVESQSIEQVKVQPQTALPVTVPQDLMSKILENLTQAITAKDNAKTAKEIEKPAGKGDEKSVHSESNIESETGSESPITASSVKAHKKLPYTKKKEKSQYSDLSSSDATTTTTQGVPIHQDVMAGILGTMSEQHVPRKMPTKPHNKKILLTKKYNQRPSTTTSESHFTTTSSGVRSSSSPVVYSPQEANGSQVDENTLNSWKSKQISNTTISDDFDKSSVLNTKEFEDYTDCEEDINLPITVPDKKDNLDPNEIYFCARDMAGIVHNIGIDGGKQPNMIRPPRKDLKLVPKVPPGLKLAPLKMSSYYPQYSAKPKFGTQGAVTTTQMHSNVMADVLQSVSMSRDARLFPAKPHQTNILINKQEEQKYSDGQKNGMQNRSNAAADSPFAMPQKYKAKLCNLLSK
ncbi:unnamed protein product [Bursaphelenchus okinawaensis]|uniref:Uncharacterized protein n=1 Tax=Bursaphelenchus okinawaensis TaxID=465554 RepID=A0A811JW68_9BILA|nr:unnamed protein product [Bursaphelenchus okinawaensis]CAG9086591.1 unnamed protein product [Bursaphelenchus okinawaensis]